MTYLVLARKWRPRSFDTLIGQDHVVRALTHALSTQRLHHAWLFTGTRGVGKTTLSRILAKSLNCETGITATPCGVCRACTEIDAGRFVDYVELDAASNRGVEEMTQLLEQAVYAPGSGRFKVYMIDEVHMLTGHAFNAMLKTLEEPPPHVKFILATTDPQKIPVTVLSRCLQFNLKQMTGESIVGHLKSVLDQESIPFETPALRLLAQAASGSMRDALSLTDQAIAYSAGNLTGEAVQGMLGTIDQRHLVELLQALADGSAAKVLDVANELAARGLSYTGALGDLAVLLSRIAIQQRIPGTIPDDDPLAEDIVRLAGALHPDQAQLFYSVAVHSRQELSLAPDEYAGFVMACLRMLALAPANASAPPPGDGRARAEPPQVETGTRPRTEPKAAPEPSPAASAGPAAHIVQQQPPAAALRNDAPVARVQAPAPMDPALAAAAARKASPPGSDDVPAWEDAPQSAGDAQPPAGHVDEQGAVAAPAPIAARAAEPPGAPDDDAGGFETMHIPDEEYFDDAGYEPVGLGDPDEAPDGFVPAQGPQEDMVPALFAAERKKAKAPRLRDMNAQAWPALAASLPLTGLAAELARQSEWLGSQGDQVTLRVAIRTLAESPGKSRLCTVLSEYFGAVVQLDVEYGATGDETAHAHEQLQRAERQKQAEQAVANDPFVQTLVNEFGAQVVPGSISATPRHRAA
ncbi:MAG TPA: DNA polymerase III subunit gamma/tau [Burkholderiaceae bacterium]|nr:DNA polymerase III subunit gamma/tau [Burkholderiaceae bacterium]